MIQSQKFLIILVLVFLLAGTTLAQKNISNDIIITRDEIKLKGKFYQAEGDRLLPTVILLHGFPGNETDVLGVGKRMPEAGINALTFNYSGTYQSEGLYSFDNTQKDIKAAYDFIHHANNIEAYKIDTSKIILGGYSYGGGMALTYAANHPEIKSVFSIAGTDHGEFFREYFRNKHFKQMIDEIFEQLTAPDGPVRFSKGTKPKDVTEESSAVSDSTYDLRKCAPLLVQKNILLIGGWDDVNVTIDNHILPLYRTLQKEKAENVTILAFQDDHAFKKVRTELADVIINWINKIK